jgi:hypothetical protein
MMNTLESVAPDFVEMAHRIVWCSAATVDRLARPRSRVLHPIWEWDGSSLVGWIATSPTALKKAHLDAHPFMSLNYWSPNQDNCTAECRAQLDFNLAARRRIWTLFEQAAAPVGYDPSIIPAWTSADADSFAIIRLDPWRLRVLPHTVLTGQGGSVLVWREQRPGATG